MTRTTLPTVIPLPLRSQYENARSAYEYWVPTAKNEELTSRSLIVEIYKLGKQSIGDKQFVRACAKNQITVKAGVLSADWILVTKWVMGDAKKGRGGRAVWEANDPQISKYAAILFVADKSGVQENDFLDWLEDEARGGGGIAKAVVKAVRNPLLRGERKQGNPNLVKADDAIRQITKKDAGIYDVRSFKVDMDAAGIKAGRHALFVDVDESGEVDIIGFSRKKDGNALLAAEYETPPVPLIENIIGLARIAKADAAVIRNTKAGLFVSVYSLEISQVRYGEIKSTTMADDVPIGDWVIDKAGLAAIQTLIHKFGVNYNSVSFDKNGVYVSPPEGISVQNAIDAHNKLQSKKHRAAVTKAKNESRIPPKKPKSWGLASVAGTVGLSDKVRIDYAKLKAGCALTISDSARKGTVQLIATKTTRNALKTTASDLKKENKSAELCIFVDRILLRRDERTPESTSTTLLEEPLVDFTTDIRIKLSVQGLHKGISFLNSISNEPGEIHASLSGLFMTVAKDELTFGVYSPAYDGKDWDSSELENL